MSGISELSGTSIYELWLQRYGNRAGSVSSTSAADGSSGAGTTAAEDSAAQGTSFADLLQESLNNSGTSTVLSALAGNSSTAATLLGELSGSASASSLLSTLGASTGTYDMAALASLLGGGSATSFDTSSLTSLLSSLSTGTGSAGNGSGTTTASLKSIFQKAASTYGLSEGLLEAVAKAESNFNNEAVSSAGAQGIMQLMPATAASLGVTDSFDAEQNIMGGAKYLAQMLERYNGDLSLALAAYNAGPGNVDKYGGIPPFTETQNYVKKVLGYLEEGVSVPDQTFSVSVGSSLESLIRSLTGSGSDVLTASAMADMTSLAKLLEIELQTSILQMQTGVLDFTSSDDEDNNIFSFSSLL